MKRFLVIVILIFMAVACRKDMRNSNGSNGYLENVQSQLRDSLSLADFSNLDFTRALISASEKEQLYFLRVPFKGKNLKNEFVIVKTNAAGKIEAGRKVKLNNNSSIIDSTKNALYKYNGFISISSLDGKPVLNSEIQNGFIKSLHQNINSRTTVMAPVYAEDVLPEVVVVAYVSDYGGISYSTWLWLNSLFYNYDYGGGGGGGNNYGSGYYGSMDGGGGYYSSGGGGYVGNYGGSSGGGSTVPQEDLMEFEAEYIYDIPEIDVWKFFNCFDQVPSSGANYTIKLCVDIPSNNNPQASSTSSGSSAGHTFLTITKSNGASKITQSFGFYPKSEPSFLDPFGSVSSTIKDNGGNEYNAAIEMNISQSQFDLIKNNAISKSTLQYNLGNYNCTNYAMDVFNSIRSTPITISPYKIYLGDPNPYGTSGPNTISIEKSPQMLFVKLQEMKTSNSTEAPKIEIDQTHNSLSPTSHGECN